MADQSFPFAFEIKRKFCRSILLKVNPEGRLLVTAPHGCPQDFIEKIIHKKIDWIKVQMDRCHQYRIKHRSRRFIDGENYLYLGKSHSLKIIQSNHFSVECTPQELIYRGNMSREPFQALHLNRLRIWFEKQAEDLIRERVELYAPKIASPTSVKIKDQNSKWGSCTSRGKLYFNWKLIMAPLSIIDYVVVHELCHLVHLNHSAEFWGLVKAVYPDYRIARKWLKEHDFDLHWNQ